MTKFILAVFGPWALILSAAAYDQAGGRICAVKQSISISGHDALYQVCKGKRLGMVREEHLIVYLD